MKQPEPQDRKNQILTRVSDALSRHRRIIAITLIVAAGLLVVLFVALQIRTSRINSSLTAIETLESDYDAWTALSDDDKSAGFDKLIKEADSVAQKYPKLYAAQRALFLKGQLYVAQGSWADAGQAFIEIADRFPQSYLAPVALMQAAIAYENDSDIDSARQVLGSIVADYGNSSAEVPRALFSLGRISEAQDEIADASDYYNQLVDDYPTSSWTNLARDRIITLTVQGRIGS